MERKQVTRETAPFFERGPHAVPFITDAALEWERQCSSKGQLKAEFLDDKVRELIGVAHSAITSCAHCAFYHTEMARVNGATDAEIQDAAREPEEFLEKIRLLSLMEEGPPG